MNRMPFSGLETQTLSENVVLWVGFKKPHPCLRGINIRLFLWYFTFVQGLFVGLPAW